MAIHLACSNFRPMVSVFRLVKSLKTPGDMTSPVLKDVTSIPVDRRNQSLSVSVLFDKIGPPLPFRSDRLFDANNLAYEDKKRMEEMYKKRIDKKDSLLNAELYLNLTPLEYLRVMNEDESLHEELLTTPQSR